MSERLQRFRKLMAAFEGTSNPQQAIERGYYVDLPNNPVKGIARRVELRPSSVHLLLGGIGSGKTTQLLLAQEHLNQLEGFNAIYVDVSLHTDISELKQGSLVAIAALEIIKLLDKIYDPEFEDNSEFKEAKETIKRLAHGYNEKKTTVIPLPKSLQDEKEKLKRKINPLNESIGFPPDLEYKRRLREIHEIEEAMTFKTNNYHKGLLSNQRLEINSELANSFSVLAKIFGQERRELVFIFDGLDRLSNVNNFNDSALNDVIALSKFGIGVVIVGSIPIAYTERIENLSHYLYYFPYPDVAEDTEAKKFFTDILNIRDSDNSITSEAKEFLITQSGGILRDLMSLTQSAIEEAYVDGSDNIKLEHAEQAIASLARSKFMGLTDENLKMLQQVVSQKNFTPRTPEDLELLLTGHILEYRHPRKHFAVHPVLIPLIQENKNLSVSHG
jgi:hypothetical protein